LGSLIWAVRPHDRLRAVRDRGVESCCSLHRLVAKNLQRRDFRLWTTTAFA
jgi:hypothetical protein